MTSIDTLDMAVQRICKTSKDLRHEVDCFCYYTVQFTFCFRLYMGDSSFEMGTCSLTVYLATILGYWINLKCSTLDCWGFFPSLIAIATLVLVCDIPFESF